MTAASLKTASGPGEAALLEAARAGDASAIRTLVSENNQRLFRVARAVLGNDAEAEDVVQEAYMNAFTHLDAFEERAAFSTWMTRIALNAALGRRRRRRPEVDIGALEREPARKTAELIRFPTTPAETNPEEQTMRAQMRMLLEEAVDQLPEPLRLVFVLREIEGLSMEETADQIGIRPETVKTRLHRARARIRAGLESRLTAGFSAVFPFDGARCTRLADRLIARLEQAKGTAG